MKDKNFTSRIRKAYNRLFRRKCDGTSSREVITVDFDVTVHDRGTLRVHGDVTCSGKMVKSVKGDAVQPRFGPQFDGIKTLSQPW